MIMLNAKLKKEAVQQLKDAVEAYNASAEVMTNRSLQLHASREKIAKLIERIEMYINMLANTPKSFDRTISKVQTNRKKFTKLLEIQYDEKAAQRIAGGGAVAGVAVGVTTAALAPTAAMVIATTFGTASTGTAIATLSGAAATNAALAWLGGGVAALGGGGMAGGNALLALAGPVGWGIGAVGLIGGGLYANKKNKAAVIKATTEYIEVQKATKVVDGLNLEIDKIKKLSNKTYNHLNKQFSEFNIFAQGTATYTALSDDLKFELGEIVNKTNAISELLNKKVGE